MEKKAYPLWRKLLSLVFLFAILLFVFIFAFSSCGTHYAKTLDPDKVEVSDIKTRDGHVIGKNGEINIKKKNLKKLPYKEIKSFMNWADSQSWKLDQIMISTDDGYSILLPGCKSSNAVYGPANMDKLEWVEAHVVDKGTYYVLCAGDADEDDLLPLSTSTSPYGINGLHD